MWDIIGKGLILIGMTALGVQQARALKRRVSCLRDALSALERLERELSFALLPVETLLTRMREGSHAALFQFFVCCEEQFASRSEERLEEVWSRVIKEAQLPLTEEDLRLWDEIGAILGRFDAASQGEALGRLHQRLGLQLGEASEGAQRLGRVYLVLCVSLGLFFVILL